MNATTAIVGEPIWGGDDVAYVFTKTKRAWAREAILKAGRGEYFDPFSPFAIDGSSVVIRVYHPTSSLSVFTRSTGSWRRRTPILPPDDAEYSFGGAVALDGDTVLARAWIPGSSGVTLVFRLSPLVTLNNLVESLLAPDLDTGIENALRAHIEVAFRVLEDTTPNNDGVAVRSLEAFTTTVEAQSGKAISLEAAAELISAAEELIDWLVAGGRETAY